MYYSEETIEEVRSRNDIIGVISQYVDLKKKGGRYFGLCPFHSEKTGSFSVSAEHQMYYCFGCGAGGNVLTFVMQYENATFGEAMQMLANRAGMELPKEERNEQQKKEDDLREKLRAVNKATATYYYKQLRSPAGDKGMGYLKRRGLTDETLKKFGLGYSPASSAPLYSYLKEQGFTDAQLTETKNIKVGERGPYDIFWNRVIFPIMDTNKRVIGFGGRVMGDGEPKYLNSPDSIIFDKSRNLYGLAYAKSSRRPYLLLCEGYMDVISLHQAGIDCAVASLGTALTEGHARLIKRYVNEVIITYDSDGAGQKAALRAIPILRAAGLSVKVLDMKPHKDPDEFITHLGVEEYERRIASAKNSFFFETDVMQSQADMRDPESVTAFHRALASRLAGFNDALERENYINAVADRYGINAAQLKELVTFVGTSQTVTEEEIRESRVVTLNKRASKGSGLSAAERVALSWAASAGLSYDQVRGYLLPEYFTDETNRQVADIVFAELEKGRTPSPASIIERFSDVEAAGKVAAIFAADPDGDDRRSIIIDKLKQVKQAYISQALREPGSPERVMELIKEKAAFERCDYGLVR